MIQKSDLRLGNYVRVKYNIKKIITLDDIGINAKHLLACDDEFGDYVGTEYEGLYSQLRAVPITANILIECNFVKEENSRWWESDCYNLELPEKTVASAKTEMHFFNSHVPEIKPYGFIRIADERISFIGNTCPLTITRRFYSVHEMQNLYFLFVGNELTLSL